MKDLILIFILFTILLVGCSMSEDYTDMQHSSAGSKYAESYRGHKILFYYYVSPVNSSIRVVCNMYIVNKRKDEIIAQDKTTDYIETGEYAIVEYNRTKKVENINDCKALIDRYYALDDK